MSTEVEERLICVFMLISMLIMFVICFLYIWLNSLHSLTSCNNHDRRSGDILTHWGLVTPFGDIDLNLSGANELNIA